MKKVSNDQRDAMFRKLRKDKDNWICCDCRDNSAQWSSATYGIFLCIKCAGVHRSLGVHKSFVRALSMDTWTESQLRAMELGGNKNMWIYWKHQDIDLDTDIKVKYSTRAAAAYKEYLSKIVEGIPFSYPRRISENENKSDGQSSNSNNGQEKRSYASMSSDAMFNKNDGAPPPKEESGWFSGLLTKATAVVSKGTQIAAVGVDKLAYKSRELYHNRQDLVRQVTSTTSDSISRLRSFFGGQVPPSQRGGLSSAPVPIGLDDQPTSSTPSDSRTRSARTSSHPTDRDGCVRPQRASSSTQGQAQTRPSEGGLKVRGRASSSKTQTPRREPPRSEAGVRTAPAPAKPAVTRPEDISDDFFSSFMSDVGEQQQPSLTKQLSGSSKPQSPSAPSPEPSEGSGEGTSAPPAQSLGLGDARGEQEDKPSSGARGEGDVVVSEDDFDADGWGDEVTEPADSVKPAGGPGAQGSQPADTTTAETGGGWGDEWDDIMPSGDEL